VSQRIRYPNDGHDWRICDCDVCKQKRRATGTEPKILPGQDLFKLDLMPKEEPRDPTQRFQP